MLRESRKKELKEHIFLTAVGLFKQKGYEQVTVDEIVSACGIAKGTFFNHFPKKEHVLLHLGTMQMARVGEVLARQQQTGLKERLQSLFGELLGAYEEHADLMKVTLAETMRSAVLMKEEAVNVAAFQELLSRMIGDAMEAGAFRSRWESPAMAQVLVGIYFNTLMMWTMQPEGGESAAELFRKQLDVVWYGMEDR